MNEAIEFLVHYGTVVLFVMVFIEQMGLPLPVVPLLLAAGALAGDGRLNLLLAIAVGVLACLLADLLWFFLGRYRGRKILGFVCRCSLEPDSCVRRTEKIYMRHGMGAVVAAKFLPGVSTIIPPLAGIFGVSTRRFLVFDGLGSLLYTGSFVLLGYIFSDQLERLAAWIAHFGKGAIVLIVAVLSAYVAFKFIQRQRVLRQFRIARVTPEELRQKQQAGESLVILDMRSPLDIEHDPFLIEGARGMRLDELENRHREIPRDRDIVLYCSCPNEVTSARVALLLHRRGIMRVRPLAGGIAAWRERNYPLVPHVVTS